ncbi:hypothetical protein M3650_25390, partial [Paenibacillus sp. MER TA 81-3]|uniref:hypothetical protein n=1 Tax=Paenibacillus sp. MER TA 81-3 TaxID=2939573 RepID=UPI002041D055
LREHRDHQPLMRYFDYTEKKRQTLQKNEELSLSGLRDFFSGLLLEEGFLFLRHARRIAPFPSHERPV